MSLSVHNCSKGRLSLLNFLAKSVKAGLSGETKSMVQFIHRGYGWTLFIVAVFLLIQFFRKIESSSFRSVLLSSMILVQFCLGVATLVLYVPTNLAAIHQIMAFLTFGMALAWCHQSLLADVRT